MSVLFLFFYESGGLSFLYIDVPNRRLSLSSYFGCLSALIIIFLEEEFDLLERIYMVFRD